MSVRVVHVAAYFAPAFAYGGPPRTILRLCQAQQRAGLDVRVVTTSANGSGELPADVQACGEYEGVPVRYCARAWPRSLFYAPSLASTVREALHHADIAHVHGLWNAAVWAAVREARRRDRPYVLSPRGMLQPAALAHDAWRKRLAYPFADRAVVEGAAVLHATSREEYATLVRRFGSGHSVMIPNGVDLPPAAGLDPPRFRAQFGLPPSAPLVVFLGRLHPIKRLDLLAAAFVALRRQHPDAHLVIAGPDEDGHRAALEPAFAAIGNAVTWTGRLDDAGVHGLLAVAAALVLCSNSESFGMSVAQALAAGVPVVATRTTPWELLVEEQAGYWVEQTPPAIAAALAAILDDPAAAAAMGARGRAIVAAHFTWDGVASALARVYAGVLGADA